MKPKKNLEEALKDKVIPLIEESMEKNLGVVIPKIEEDITDKLRQNTLELFFNLDLTFLNAKKIFKKQFFEKELLRHHGNISQLAKFLGIDRRSIHRTIKDLGIQIQKTRPIEQYTHIDYDNVIQKTIRNTIDQYKDVIKDERIESMYKDLPTLSKTIARTIPHKEFTWKQAEKEFEKEYFKHHLKLANGNKTQVALQTGLRLETISRKLKKLGL